MNIIDELEQHAKQVMPNYPNDVCSRAKAEIERLQAELAELRAEPAANAEYDRKCAEFLRNPT